MKSFIETFHQQLQQGLDIANAANIRPEGREIHNIVLTGLGGSAFGGEISKSYLATKSKIPFIISREYEVPAFVGKNTLLLACSYSGNTEETLSAVAMAEAQGAEIVCITSGGKLKEIAESTGKNLIVIPGGYPPRAAAGFAVVQQLQVLQSYGIIPDFRADLAEVMELVANFNDHELAQNIAKPMKGKFLFVYSSIAAECIAIRWRQQIEENSKQLVSHHIVPEMNHNELVGWKQPAELMQYTHITFLETSFDHERVRMRMNLNKQIIAEHSSEVHTVSAKGKTLLGQLFYLLHLGDWVSYYLAVENNEDPMPVKVIDYLKNELSKV